VSTSSPAVPDDLTRALADRFELRDILGRGGMATVYMAHDRKHFRDVAVKVLRPDIAASIGADRFLKEIQIVARMVHPHILSLHDSGEADGFVYYVMPFIDGGSLRQRIEKHTRMSAADALGIAKPIADALTYAHQCGVLHRDIKPENVLFARAHPIVADFGIAKAVSSANSGAQLTRTGISLGTPGYMSPEQAAGFNDVDEKTDVYALAILVYEMIVGEIPGRWVTEDSTREGRFLDASPKHRMYLASAGPVFEGALVRALALRPDQRTATPAQFIEELSGTTEPPKRKYRPDEIERIVNRAAELQDSNPTSSGSMTMGGIEQLGRDVGIPADALRRAEKSLSPHALSTRETTIDPPKNNFLIGGPTRLLFERTIAGEVEEADFPILVEEIRILMSEVGTVSQLGRSFTWTLNKGANGMGRMMEVAVTSRGGRTRIIIQESLANLIGGIWGGVGGGMGGGGLGPLMGGLIGGKVLVAAAAWFLVPAWLTITYFTARTSYFYSVRSKQRELERLANRLADLTRDLIYESAPRLGAPRRDELR
jgi:serine/threonine protein kinase